MSLIVDEMTLNFKVKRLDKGYVLRVKRGEEDSFAIGCNSQEDLDRELARFFRNNVEKFSHDINT
jgi:hypothetical protein